MERRLFAWLGVCVWLGCAHPPLYFQDREHRTTYDFQVDELKTVQFYTSQEILAHEVGASGTLEGPDHVMIVSPGTPGAVIDAGPHWLRVSFGSGPGALFLANPDLKPDSVYALATESEAGGPPVRVKDLADPIVTVGERHFRIIRGVSASLLIDADDLARLIEARPHAPGHEPSK